MKKRRSDSGYVSDPDSHLHASALSGATDGSHLNTIVSAKQFRQISKGKTERRSHILSTGSSCALLSAAPPPYVTSAATR